MISSAAVLNMRCSASLFFSVLLFFFHYSVFFMLEYYVYGSPPPRRVSDHVESNTFSSRYPQLIVARLTNLGISFQKTWISNTLRHSFSPPTPSSILRNQTVVHVNPENRTHVHRRVFLRIICDFSRSPIVSRLSFYHKFLYVTPLPSSSSSPPNNNFILWTSQIYNILRFCWFY